MNARLNPSLTKPRKQFKTNSLTAILFTTSITGCTAQLTLNSQPEGAYITEYGTGRFIGITPVAVEYQDAMLKQHENGYGCFMVNGFEARWASGATAATENPMPLCYQKSSWNAYTVTFNRDPSVPGLEKDVQFAVEIQTMRAQQQATKTADSAAALAGLLTIWAASQPAIQQPTMQQPAIQQPAVQQPSVKTNVRCTTRLNLLGTSADTDCR